MTCLFLTRRERGGIIGTFLFNTTSSNAATIVYTKSNAATKTPLMCCCQLFPFTSHDADMPNTIESENTRTPHYNMLWPVRELFQDFWW
jgi:hypothetical protein